VVAAVNNASGVTREELERRLLGLVRRGMIVMPLVETAANARRLALGAPASR
jgi:hypothetical protein